MELHFAERLKKYRRECDMTQEELAQKIGISHQSVSKWERGDGLPDVTLLPGIAGCFGVSIDALLGYDEITKEEDFKIYFREHLEIHDSQEKFEYILGYARKYPKDYRYARDLVEAITKLPPEKWEEHMPLMREMCEKIVNECTIQWYRENAIRDMCLVCPDAELEKWYMMCGAQYEAYRDEVLEKRLWLHGKKEECVLRHGINNFYMLCHFLSRNNRDRGDMERRKAWILYKMKLVEFLGDGEVPEIWLGLYAESAADMVLTLFRNGETEEGYRWLDTAFERYERWCAIPDGAHLDTGDPGVFGGIKGVRGRDHENSWNIVLPDGSMEYFQEAYAYILPHKTDIYARLNYLYEEKRVPDRDRLLPYIERAKVLAGIEE